jgi:hypothetical protein
MANPVLNFATPAQPPKAYVVPSVTSKDPRTVNQFTEMSALKRQRTKYEDSEAPEHLLAIKDVSDKFLQ